MTTFMDLTKPQGISTSMVVTVMTGSLEEMESQVTTNKLPEMTATTSSTVDTTSWATRSSPVTLLQITMTGVGKAKTGKYATTLFTQETISSKEVTTSQEINTSKVAMETISYTPVVASTAAILLSSAAISMKKEPS